MLELLLLVAPAAMILSVALTYLRFKRFEPERALAMAFCFALVTVIVTGVVRLVEFSKGAAHYAIFVESQTPPIRLDTSVRQVHPLGPRFPKTVEISFDSFEYGANGRLPVSMVEHSPTIGHGDLVVLWLWDRERRGAVLDSVSAAFLYTYGIDIQSTQPTVGSDKQAILPPLRSPTVLESVSMARPFEARRSATSFVVTFSAGAMLAGLAAWYSLKPAHRRQILPCDANIRDAFGFAFVGYVLGSLPLVFVSGLLP